MCINLFLIIIIVFDNCWYDGFLKGDAYLAILKGVRFCPLISLINLWKSDTGEKMTRCIAAVI